MEICETVNALDSRQLYGCSCEVAMHAVLYRTDIVFLLSCSVVYIIVHVGRH